MKLSILFSTLIISTTFSFAQTQERIDADMTRYHSIVNSLNSLHDIDFCDCKKGENAYYLYSFTFMPFLTIDSITYPSHFIAIIDANAKRTKQSATVYENLITKDTIPNSGWPAFFSVMDSLDLDNMAAHYSTIPCTVIAHPDAIETIFFHCKNGSLRPHITLRGLDIVTSLSYTPEMYQEAGIQLLTSKRILDLFYNEFDAQMR